MKKKWNFETRITLTYLVLGIGWIIITDFLLENASESIMSWTQMQSAKGIIFVLISSLVIFMLSRRYSKQQKFIKKHLQKSKEIAEESDRLKSVFLANMSHEIRTPMNGILGFVRLLEEPNLTAEQRALYLGYVKKSALRLLDTINDIIEISKIESEEAVLHRDDVDLNESISYLYGFFKPIAEEKGLSFVLKNGILGEKTIVHTDKIKLESVLINIIKNAFKFTHEGFVEFGCNFLDGAIVFYVKDSGIGIPSDRQDAIFERFTQADLSITKPYEGSGLGLSIARAYAALLGGKIWLESEPGKGSTFWFSMKLEPVKQI
ncbi:sensor histidine kinase [Mariniphaga sediminis]|uniref:sensor histidine kinase n=1 Tax=Mariniphaga sediminis TaxID=1628158 RepID=UPI0035621DCE